MTTSQSGKESKMATTIKCDNCGNEIEITEAIKKELEQKILAETEIKHKEEVKRVREEALASAKQEATEKVQKEFELKIRIAKEESEENGKQVKELQGQVSTLIKDLREAKDAEGKIKIDYEKKLLEEQDRIKRLARNEADDEYGLKLAQKDKQMSDLEKKLKEAQRKAQQNSQQSQGEIMEVTLEDLLRKEFPMDDIEEVPKGKKGADVIQRVKTQSGFACGTIIWESKNTQKWSQSWVQKLVDDQRAAKAEIAVLVSQDIPDSASPFGICERVWVSDFRSAIGLAYALRQKLVDVRGAQDLSKGKSTKAEIVYDYLISNDFKQKIEVWIEYFVSRKEEIDKERVYFSKKWEKEEKSIHRVIENTAGIYGDLQGLIGNALPKINYLELPEGKEK